MPHVSKYLICKFSTTLTSFIKSCLEMMYFYLLLLGTSSTVFGNPLGLPSFEWVSHDNHLSTLPLLKIRFPDGQDDDFAVLKHFNVIPVGRNEDPFTVDTCIYDGYLSNEKDVYVTMTGGCAFSKSFEIQFRSKRLQGHMFKVTNDHVEELTTALGRKILDVTGNQEFISDNLASSDVSVAGGNRALNPYGYLLNVTIRYDDNFKGKFGADAENVIRRVMAHAQNIYQWESLTTKIIFNVLSIAHRTGVWVTGDDGHGVKDAYALNDGTISDEFLYFTFGHNGGVGGIARGGICSPWSPKGAACLTEYTTSDVETGNTLAHEMGHNFGMGHDFDQASGSSEVPRFDSKGKTCLRIGGIMDYWHDGNVPLNTLWSTCSVEDLIKYVDEMSKYSNSGFCLEPNV